MKIDASILLHSGHVCCVQQFTDHAGVHSTATSNFRRRKTDLARPPGPQISQSCEALCARVNTCDITLNLLALCFHVSLPQAAVVLVDERMAVRAQSAGPLFQRSSEHQPGARRTEPGRPAEGAKAEAAPARPRVKMARSILVLGVQAWISLRVYGFFVMSFFYQKFVFSLFFSRSKSVFVQIWGNNSEIGEGF